MWRSLSNFIFLMCLTLVNCEPKVPCFFIFGDSYSDAGSNNALFSLAKANYPPYGIDFPGGTPTGRFTNGLNCVDYIAQFLGFGGFIEPYRNNTGQDALKGINFASGSAGILSQTAYHVGDRVWMDRQLENYKTVITKLEPKVKGPIGNYLNKCLYSVNIGTNDYINNYFLPLLYPFSKFYSPDEYSSMLIARYTAQLQALYDFGARKIAVYGLGPLGCLPFEVTKSCATECVLEKNQAVQLFNTKLVSLVDQFNTKLPGAKFIFVDTFAILNLTALPGLIMNSTCCEIVTISNLCKSSTPPCPNRKSYAYMDGIHPTEVVNQQIAISSYTSQDPLFVHPINISQLITS
ncbi:GDSL esterase/lipase At1g29670-like [Chenopodium quinoa]|uniref:GDSL esterase/lipase At1g29670-like n=1 Tax=Chenopodium quinoa TaxID=63459 RepID=UPI000B78B5D0|nr:GDSL esterase/lipase At1g29670-like [Chenopodium quinoa]